MNRIRIPQILRGYTVFAAMRSTLISHHAWIAILIDGRIGLCHWTPSDPENFGRVTSWHESPSSAMDAAPEADLALRRLRDWMGMEPGADGLPQMVIPGAEHISDRQLAERRQAAPMRARADQKTPGGLFDGPDTQTDLFGA